MTVVMVQMSWAVERKVSPAAVHPLQCLLLLGRAVRIISGVIVVSYIFDKN
jgi:hypothetical protein